MLRFSLRAESSGEDMGGRSRRAGVLLLLVGLVAVAGCRRSGPAPAAEAGQLPDGTPVILISIDTLRSDRLPIYGYDHVATPAIDRLRDDSILFQNAYTHVGLTLPSHSSVLSGLLPLAHGVRDNVGYRFPEDVATLPALLKERGYATGAFVSSYVLRAKTGLDRGFDVYDDDILFETGKQLGVLQRSGGETLEKARQWLEGVQSQPFFLFFHIYEPHAPYEPPEPYASRYAAAYDGEVAAADDVIGRLLAELERLGVYDEAVVVLLSDHGEGLMDHGEMDHLVFIYREVLQVPLLLKLPGGERAGSTVEAPAQLTDVFSTLVSLLGIEPDPRAAGVSLLALGQTEGQERRLFAESVYPRIHFGWSDLASVIEGRYHFIWGPDPELYDLREDPQERENIVRRQARVASRLRDEIERYDRALESPAESSPETLESLRALGYLSGGVRTTDGPLPDPKAKIHLLADLGRGTVLARNGEHEAAAEAFTRVVDEEPGMPFAWQQLATVLRKQGDRRGALEAMVEALKLSDGSPDIAASVAELYFELGELDQARAHAELALPSSPHAHSVLANINLREGDLDAAERHLEQALADRGRRIESLIIKSALLNRRGRHQEALEVCDQAEVEFGSRVDRQVLHGLYFQRGASYGSLGRFAEAKTAYRRSIELAPRHLAAYTSLAFLYALENQGPEAGRVLEEMVTENPSPAAYAEAVKTLRAMKDEAMARAVLGHARRRWPDDERLRSM